jgi:hypothetical protein
MKARGNMSEGFQDRLLGSYFTFNSGVKGCRLNQEN